MKTSRVWVAAALLAFPLAASAAGSPGPGAKLYADHCAMCHGSDGKAVMPGAGDMTDPKGPLSKPDDVLVKSTLDGVGNMPGFKGQLSKSQIDDILAYMRKAFGVRPGH